MYEITPEEAREHLGIRFIISTDPGKDEIHGKLGARKASGGVTIQHLGTVQNINGAALNPLIALPKTHPKARLVPCPLEVAREYDPDDLFVLTVDGRTLCTPDVKQKVGEGMNLLFVRIPDPEKEPNRIIKKLRANSIIVAWIPSLSEHGTGVLKRFKHDKDGFTLESYHADGGRYPKQNYPNIKPIGIALGFWVEFE